MELTLIGDQDSYLADVLYPKVETACSALAACEKTGKVEWLHPAVRELARTVNDGEVRRATARNRLGHLSSFDYTLHLSRCEMKWVPQSLAHPALSHPSPAGPNQTVFVADLKMSPEWRLRVLLVVNVRVRD